MRCSLRFRWWDNESELELSFKLKWYNKNEQKYTMRATEHSATWPMNTILKTFASYFTFLRKISPIRCKIWALQVKVQIWNLWFPPDSNSNTLWLRFSLNLPATTEPIQVKQFNFFLLLVWFTFFALICMMKLFPNKTQNFKCGFTGRSSADDNKIKIGHSLKWKKT